MYPHHKPSTADVKQNINKYLKRATSDILSRIDYVENQIKSYSSNSPRREKKIYKDHYKYYQNPSSSPGWNYLESKYSRTKNEDSNKSDDLFFTFTDDKGYAEDEFPIVNTSRRLSNIHVTESKYRGGSSKRSNSVGLDTSQGVTSLARDYHVKDCFDSENNVTDLKDELKKVPHSVYADVVRTLSLYLTDEQKSALGINVLPDDKRSMLNLTQTKRKRYSSTGERYFSTGERDLSTEGRQKDSSTGERQRDFSTGERQRDFTTGERQRDFTTGGRQRDFTTGERQRDFSTGERQRDFTIGEKQRDFSTGERQTDFSIDERQRDSSVGEKERVSSTSHMSLLERHRDSPSGESLPGTWHRGRKGFTPPDTEPVVTTRSGFPLFAGRVSYHGNLIPATVSPEKGLAYFSWNGKVFCSSDYEVLEVHHFAWVDEGAARDSLYRFPLGRGADGTPLYLGRVYVEGMGPWVGRVHRDQRTICIAFRGNELRMPQPYELFVIY